MTQDQTPPAQHQNRQPGSEAQMRPQPVYISERYRGSGKLAGKVAIITGADSGIGRAVAVHFAREGAKVLLSYLNEHEDARVTSEAIEQEGAAVISHAGDIAELGTCQALVDKALQAWGRIDVLVNNAGEQHPQEQLENITAEQWEKTFKTNIFSMFQLLTRVTRCCWIIRPAKVPLRPSLVPCRSILLLEVFASMQWPLALSGRR